MGPLYGMFFAGMADVADEHEEIDAETFGKMLGSALREVQEIGSAQRGDKTLLDTLIPAFEAYEAALGAGKDFSQCLAEMDAAAEKGWKSTEDMIAKIGRASRLGERSRGVLDAGATSCYLLLHAMAETAQSLLQKE